MPIALYPELAQALVDTASRLELWARLASLEEQLLRRAQGAFLVHWFGPLIPEYRLNLHVGIANIAELKARLAAVNGAVQRSTSMNLTRPLAAMLGTIFGSGMSVSGVILQLPYVHDLLEWLSKAWWSALPKLLYTTLVLWVLPAFGPAAGLFLGVPLVGLWALGTALGNDRETRAEYGLMGDLAMMLDAFLIFWDQLTGPLDKIRNPVLRGLVGLMHRVAHLFAQVLGFVSLIVVKVLPLIPSLFEQWRAIKALGADVVSVAADALSTMMDDLMAPFGQGSIFDLVMGLFAALAALPGKIIDTVTALIVNTLTTLAQAKDAVTKLVTDFATGLADRIVKAFDATPLGLLIGRIKSFLEVLPRLAALFDAIGKRVSPKAPDKGPSKIQKVEDSLRDWKTRIYTGMAEGLVGGLLPGKRAGKPVGADVGPKLADVIGAARKLSLPSLPTIKLPALPKTPVLPDIAALEAKIGAPAPHDLVADGAKLLKEAQDAEAKRKLPAALLRRPKSAFAQLLKANAAPAAPSEMQLKLRDAIYFAVGRVLPAALRLQAPKLREYFDKLDKAVYDIAPTAGAMPDQPQLDLADSGLLQPIVELLTIRAPEGSYAPDLRAFRDMVRAALLQQTYAAADSAAVGG